MGQITVNLPDSLHRRAKRLAEESGVSLNTMICVALAEKISLLEGTEFFEERAKRGSKLSFDEVLSVVPSFEPPDYDKL